MSLFSIPRKTQLEVSSVLENGNDVLVRQIPEFLDGWTEFRGAMARASGSVMADWDATTRTVRTCAVVLTLVASACMIVEVMRGRARGL